ncbi:hypothetical protein A33Q_0770 [Indibacter alkaliphilus LW1]|uniref:Uncharacterized protein n=1 Tax=Indibacter alkaliphilus (strain CCUG 57479 / KCTC 22604 / LW1) TaxID=1189612 RepID=S2DJF5_INDAL|nr:hypothetical protein A33Q_0770 [Indibacter alkaliphilus LW1]
MGRYQFESNSQHQSKHIYHYAAVIPLGRYQFESNSQL